MCNPQESPRCGKSPECDLSDMRGNTCMYTVKHLSPLTWMTNLEHRVAASRDLKAGRSFAACGNEGGTVTHCDIVVSLLRHHS